MNEKRDKKVILFSTRFLETDGKLFCEDNIASPDYCCSPEYLKFFLSNDLPSEIVQYFNRLYYKSFFSQYKDEDGKSIINVEDNSKEIREKLWKKIPEVEYSKPLWMSFFSDLDKKEKLFEITVNKEKAKFEFKDKDVDAKSLLKIIQDNEGSVHNQDVILNTDFGGATNKQTIDRRFKIYRLKGCNAGNIQAVYGVWCLKEKREEEKWYKALYEELKNQMKDDFKLVTEILYFLHDGDIGEKKPFDVKYYKEDKKTFSFLDENKTISVAIFQHSLSSIASILSNTNINSAIKAAMTEMEKGGQKACLYKLSDYLASYKGKTDDTKLKKLLDDAQKLFAKENENNDDEAFLKSCYQLSNSEEKEDVFYDANHDINELLRKLHNK